MNTRLRRLMPAMQGGAAAAAWTPASPTAEGEASPSLWLKADAGLYQDAAKTTPATLADDPIGAWENQVSGDTDATQATADSRPTLQFIEGVPVILFDGSDDTLGITISADASQSLFFVARNVTQNFANRRFIGYRDEASVFYTTTNTKFGYFANQANGVVDLGGDITVFTAIGLVYASTASANAYLDDGAAIPFDPKDATYDTSTTITLGGSTAAQNRGNVHLSEVVRYTSPLSADDIQQVMNYLIANKPPNP